jgi:tetratricopeptide (TPR) repeat protein
MALGAMMLLGGCAKISGAPPRMLRQMARSYLVGVTYDQALIASRQDNARALRNSLNQLEELDATDVAVDLQLSRAEDQVRAASILQSQALQVEQINPARSHLLQGEATRKYRSALRWSPRFPSRDPELLNALGYFLADRGANERDFENAAEFTRRALALLNKTIADNAQAGVSSQAWFRQMRQTQANTQDSYAWALYKLQRYGEAEAAQAKTLELAKNSGLNDRLALAELWFHQAKILQALGKTAEANAAMQESRRLHPEKRKR